MEAADINDDVVHPEVRAHITNLVSALGGYSADDDGSYKLGDEALDVLRDLKKWIRFYDEKTNRMDVARCLAEANLVGGDLLQILTLWPQSETDSKYKARIALACFEVMVPLTWPIEKERAEMTINHHRHMPVLQLAQLGYKRAIINFDAIPILNTAVRVALPSMAMPIGERTPRDQAIIKLILFFLRNVAMIAPPQGVKCEGDETQVSRSATIDAFSYQDIFLTLLTLASNMGEDFRTEDVVIMEIIFHLVKRVDPSSLFVSEKQLNKAKGQELASEMRKEAAMLKSYNKTTTTRHSRFGTMIWVKRADGKMVTVSGQEALLDAKTRERKMDNSKTFRPPRRARKPEMEPKDLGPPVTLDERARQQLRSFVQDFLDSGFNPLFLHVRQSIDREALHALNQHKSQFFYLVAWFLEAERMRRKAKRDESKSTSAAGEEVNSFNLVAAVLQQEMFASMNRALDRSYSDKDWQLLTSVMRCYTQIFLTVQEMSESPNEEDQEIAENTLSRLFYEETTHDLIANIARTYKDQGFEYLDAATELVHTFLRILEGYSKQNVDLQVRSRKRARRKKKAAKAAAAVAAARAAGEEAEDVGVPEDNDADDSGDDEQHAERVTQERKFEFGKFAIRFAPQGVVDTFVAFTKFYRDLNDAQLKRAHRYFYRVAFKLELSIMLFRLDIINLFYNMVQGPEPLDKSSPMFKEWEELSKQIIRKCVKKLQERPALFTELLFSKIGSTTHFLEHGYEKPVTTTTPRPGAELEFKRATERDEQIGIAVSVLIDKQQVEHLQWLKDQLTSAMSERQAWENVDKAMAATTEGAADGEAADERSNKSAPPHITIRPDTEARRTAMFKNPHLRLLMRLVGMERLTPTLDETPDSTWILPGSHTAEAIQDTIDLINKAEFSPPTFEDGGSAEDQLRRKSAAASRRTRAAYDDDEEEIRGFLGDDDDEDFLFAPGGPTARKPDARPQKKRQRKRRREAGSGDEEDEGVSDEVLAARAKKRREKELEKIRKIKSEMYVHASDDETDDERDREFFERERKRQETKDSKFDSMLGALGLSVLSQVNGGEKSAWEAVLDDEPESDESENEGRKNAKRRKKQVASGSEEEQEEEEEEEEEEDSDEELPTKQAKSKTSKRKAAVPSKRPARRPGTAKKRAVVELSDNDEDEDEEEDAMDVDSANERTTRNEAPLPSSPGEGLGRRIDKMAMDDGDEDEDDQPVVAARQRPKARGGFIIDSSDEE
ncbi:putative drug resistance protein MdrA [Neurospora crassa]|uniref:Topoisomerase 1-associated factor 1 n=1 Tax=Neurospora crassa (strain ATCC 24698 / 74-OR23-1A / CBS 708.71 / DSM 1257 / FGSC 987) TaxID=367110 RepID=TOF1_NEUCR|nr:topoisomerase 1-associated factor 1 [Neurospora crassa OR74A]Q7S2A9.1 RecName: Full=Topoisomerase 1-associated factor 1 [Neurospora crassa OR74A]EAA29535.1 topoisomerase 1-associated factor 1 [Neurospora crassa OR74A]KHE83636.1 putative drug resistance protein MdrA [Neurospora crassa]CAE76157.1 probable drug resistance protein MdrA [Neurospora crassa]|eukprot:XP_958771.1 topoisomerase 1-associated factor 1 [Neurospora crassa OR74A]